jgi:hypothetical protein
MQGKLQIRDLSQETIEVRLVGRYEAPLGLLGTVGDRLFGRRAATASLDDYVERVATRLARHLAAHHPPQYRPSVGSQRVQRAP